MFETSFEITLLIVLTLLGVIGWVVNILGMPGSWGIVTMAGLCMWLRPEELQSHVTWVPFVLLILAALLGELLEFAAGALGASQMGGTWRGTALAIFGSLGGALTGLVFGNAIPIPIIGPLVASLLLGASGAFAGAIAGERWAGKDWDASIQIGSAAFWGRLLGTVGKAVCGTIVCAIFLVSIWL